jgi:enamine deaminase RidA (YjgF/YER057c/UK114 family)
MMRLDQSGTRLWGILRSSRSRRREAQRPVMHRVAGGGARVAVAEHEGIRHLFATAVSCAGGEEECQAREAVESVAAALAEVSDESVVVQLVVFVAEPRRIESCRRVVRESFRRAEPATSYVLQKPVDGMALAVEAWAVAPGRVGVEVDHVGGQVVEVRHDGLTWVHCGQVVGDTASTRVYDRSAGAFEAMRDLLAGQGLGFEQVVRTWIYLGDIVGPEGDTQRYKELNRARADFFARVGFRAERSLVPSAAPAYPASTGIGADGRDVVLGGLALATDRDDVQVVPLENPRQTAAFDYAASYSPRSPKFSRAMAVASPAGAVIFVSGTASITRSETRHENDAAAQTRETLDNIASLIAEANLADHGLRGLGATLDQLGMVRVYVKRPGDYESVRAVCEATLGTVPATYTIADVCRPELLVEIEGIAFSRRASNPTR